MKALVYRLSPARWAFCKLLSMLNPAAAVGRLSSMQLEECPIPEPVEPGWVRLRTILGGVCGTDLALVGLRNHPATILQRCAEFPAILGHENVAVVDALGPGVSGWAPGERVCAEPAVNCRMRGAPDLCPSCAEGRSSLCSHPGDARFPPRAMIGYNRWTGGSWAPYFLAHESQLHRVPSAVPDDMALLTDPIATSLHAVFRRPPRSGERVLVCGSGIIAFGVLAVLKALGGCDATAIVRHEFQAGIARQMGASQVLLQPRRLSAAHRYDQVAAHVGGARFPARFGNQMFLGGFDLTYDCTGSPGGLTDAMKWTRSRGTVVVAGTTGIGTVDATPMWFDELKILGANGQHVEPWDNAQRHAYDLVLDWMTTGRLDLAPIPVARFDLRNYRAAFSNVLRPGRSRIVKLAFVPHIEA